MQTADALDQRRSLRYATTIDLKADFAGCAVTIRNLGATGFQIEHAERIEIGTPGLLRFVYPPSFDPEHRNLGIADRQPDSNYAEYRCTTVWSRLDRNALLPVPAYRTGLVVNSGNVYPFLLPVLLREFIEPETDGLGRRQQRDSVRRMRAQEHADQLMLARAAAHYLEQHPAEAYQWHRRARYALSCRNVAFEENPALGHTPETIAVWEFLSRHLPLHTIAQALAERRH